MGDGDWPLYIRKYRYMYTYIHKTYLLKITFNVSYPRCPYTVDMYNDPFIFIQTTTKMPGTAWSPQIPPCFVSPSAIAGYDQGLCPKKESWGLPLVSDPKIPQKPRKTNMTGWKTKPKWRCISYQKWWCSSLSCRYFSGRYRFPSLLSKRSYWTTFYL